MATQSLSKAVILATLLLFLSGCATTSQTSDVNDPLEGYNRAMYSFNTTVDKAIIKPASELYDAVLPAPVSWGVSNFFNNLSEVTVIVNDLLQFKFEQAADDFGRFALNSTVGFAGIFDVAGHAGYKSHDEDFGQTLGYWGIESGPYLVLPLFGPSNVRDTFGLVANMATNPTTYVDHNRTRNAISIVNLLDKRASLLGASKVLDQATDDEYLYVRDAYTQRRQNLVFDGAPPEDDFDVFAD